MNFNIQPTDKSFAAKMQEKIDNLNKPKGSLGRLESLALQLGLIQHSLSPELHHPCHVLFCADHGIERENVSISPREITWQQMLNFGRGGAGINMFCRQHGFKLRVVDVGVDYDFEGDGGKHIINRKIARGTHNFLHEAAMSESEFDKAITIGAEMAEACYNEGCNVISFGEMGIANTSPSSVWMHLFLDIPLEQCVGAGAGLNSEGKKHKFQVIKEAVDKFMAESGIRPRTFSEHSVMSVNEAKTVIRYFGGFEMVAAIGGMLRAAELGMVVLVDGFIMTACMLAASRIFPEVMDYAVFGHKGDESGHSMMLDAMSAAPLLSLGLRLGEGTGAVCAYPILQSAVNMMNEMDNFAHAEITKYF